MNFRAEYLPLVAVLIFTCCSTAAAQNQATCDALDNMIASSSALSCTRNTACNTTDCTSTVLPGYSLTLVLLSCRNPPGVHFILKQGGSVVYDNVVDHSVSGISVGLGTISITLDQFENEIGLKVTLNVFSVTTDIIPYTRIPLDTQSCAPPTTEAPTTDTSSPDTSSPDTPNTPITDTSSPDTATTQTPTQGTPSGANPTEEVPFGPTCDGFDRLISNVMQMTCTRNTQCDTANCTISNPNFNGYTISMTLLSCRQPRPGVRLVARDATGTLLVDRVLDESQSGIELTPTTLLDVTLDQLNSSAIGLAANVRVNLGLTTLSVPLLTYTILPLDRRSCPPQGTVTDFTPSPITEGPTNSSSDVPTPATDDVTDTTAPTTNGTTPATEDGTTEEPSVTDGETPTTTTDETPSVSEEPTTEGDGKNTTCAVLARLAADAELFDCTADMTEPCDTVHCTTSGYTAVIVLLPCVTPAAVRLTISQGETVALNKTIDHSDRIVVPELFGLVLDITLDHFEDAIGLQVVGTIGPQTFNVVKYTVIPLERAKNCRGGGKNEPGTEADVPSSTEDPSSSSAGFTSALSWSLLLLPLITFSMK